METLFAPEVSHIRNENGLYNASSLGSRLDRLYCRACPVWMTFELTSPVGLLHSIPCSQNTCLLTAVSLSSVTGYPESGEMRVPVCSPRMGFFQSPQPDQGELVHCYFRCTAGLVKLTSCVSALCSNRSARHTCNSLYSVFIQRRFEFR